MHAALVASMLSTTFTALLVANKHVTMQATERKELAMAKSYGIGAMPPSLGWRVVTNIRTLRALERLGWIVIPPEHGKKGRSAIGPVIHRYVEAGPKATENGRYWGAMFEFRGRTFRLTYLDGCFCPFVTEYKGGHE